MTEQAGSHVLDVSPNGQYYTDTFSSFSAPKRVTLHKGTAWNNYDSIYTERYMRRPKDNPDGYYQSSAMNFVENLKGKLFIHHGSVDNNVHVGNVIQLLNALLEANKKFDFMLYPKQDHRIDVERYSESRVEYFVEHLKPDVL